MYSNIMHNFKGKYKPRIIQNPSLATKNVDNLRQWFASYPHYPHFLTINPQQAILFLRLSTKITHYAVCSMISRSAMSAMNSPLVGLSFFV